MKKPKYLLLAVLLLTAPVVGGNPFAAQLVKGTAAVTDGDTIKVNGTVIRMHGIDAPESAQRCENAAGTLYACGEAATAFLKKMAGGKTVECEVSGTGRYGRSIAVCFAGKTDLNKAMVAAGHAVAYYSKDYAPQESAAKKAKRGVWRGKFVGPSRWRKGERLAGQGAGVVKKSKSGICHDAGSKWYGKTKNFKPFDTLEGCLKSGGREPKR